MKRILQELFEEHREDIKSVIVFTISVVVIFSALGLLNYLTGI